MSCKACYDDLDETTMVENIFIDVETIHKQSNFCNDCVIYMLNNIFPNLINTIKNETCEKTLKEILSVDLPTHLTVDGTGRGKIIDKIKINKRIRSTDLTRNIPDEDIDYINEQMKIIHSKMDNEMYSYIDDIKTLFDKYV